MTTPPGVEAAAQHEPADGWRNCLKREDGTSVCWGDTATGRCWPHAEADLWNLPATRCPCRCHQPEALDTARST